MINNKQFFGVMIKWGSTLIFKCLIEVKSKNNQQLSHKVKITTLKVQFITNTLKLKFCILKIKRHSGTGSVPEWLSCYLLKKEKERRVKKKKGKRQEEVDLLFLEITGSQKY